MSKVIASLGGINSPIRVTLDEYEGVRTIDIRKFYKEKSTQEFKHTNKGIALTDASFNELMLTLSDSWPTINDWLSGIVQGTATDDSAQKVAIKASVKFPKTVDIDREQLRGPILCSVRSEGDSVAVVFNENHSLFSALSVKESITRDEMQRMIAHLFVALHIARYQSEVDGSVGGQIVDFNSLMHISARLLGALYKK